VQIGWLVTSQQGPKVVKNKIWNICANNKSTGLKFCGVDVLQELYNLMSP